MIDLDQKKELLKQILKDRIDSRKNKSMVFLYCSPRSGSTVLRLMLAGHSNLFSPPEFHLLKYNTLNEWAEDIEFNNKYGGLVRSIKELMEYNFDQANEFVADLIKRNVSVKEVYHMIQNKLGKRMLVDKSPSYTSRVEILKQAENLFHNPLYIYLIRHPYSVIESIVRNRIYTYSMMKEEDPFIFAEKTWLIRNQNCIEFFKKLDSTRCLTVKFEELVTNPRKILEGICKFLGISFEKQMMHPYEGNRMIDGAGDPNIFNHDKIVSSLGDTWKNIKLPTNLKDETRLLAKQLNYELPCSNL